MFGAHSTFWKISPHQQNKQQMTDPLKNIKIKNGNEVFYNSFLKLENCESQSCFFLKKKAVIALIVSLFSKIGFKCVGN